MSRNAICTTMIVINTGIVLGVSIKAGMLTADAGVKTIQAGFALAKLGMFISLAKIAINTTVKCSDDYDYAGPVGIGITAGVVYGIYKVVSK